MHENSITERQKMSSAPIFIPAAPPSPSHHPRFSHTMSNNSSNSKQLLIQELSNKPEKESPYLEPTDNYGSYPPPPPPIIKKPNLAMTQPVRPANIVPPTTPRSPRKYNRAQQETTPYSSRRTWQQRSQQAFFDNMQQRYQVTKEWNRVYSSDFLKMRQHSIERVRSAKKQKEIDDRKHRSQECKQFRKYVELQKKKERFYNDEVFCRTGKQYRYIPIADRCSPREEYIFI